MKLKIPPQDGETKLQRVVRRWLNKYGENYDNGWRGALSDLREGGCQSGIINGLVYYRDTVRFYKRHKKEIDELLAQILRAPRASAYVLTTENAPRTVQNHEVAPLYLLDRGRIWPTGCNPGAAGCNINNRDFILLSSIDQMNNAVAAGYSYRGYQGFLYKTQAPGTQALYLKCNTNEDDCAVFIESQRSQFEIDGYTSNFPTASTSILGYAYPSTDSDSDGLVDGMELVIGTDPNDSNSDDDGLTDVQEFPMDGISNSDPCDAIPSTCTAPSATPLFADGFE